MIVTATAAGPAAVEIDQKAVCLECHDLELDAAVAHPPARDGDCSACHNPHVSRFAGLLKERPGPLCLSCHGDLTAGLEQAVVHGPVAEGRCTDCHEPHGGAHGKLLVAEGTDLCRSCHQEIVAWEERPVRHSPFRRDKCFICHESHAAAFPHLSKRAAGETCAMCHPRNAKFSSAHQGYPVEQTACGGCHDPHASSQAGFFRENLHFPFADGECSDCHLPPDAEEPFGLAARQDQLCGDCHDEQVEASREAAFPHVSAGGGACTACHNPHAGDGGGLLNEPLQELCLSCHDPGGAASGEAGRYTGHGDLDCSACHASHGGDRPVLLVAEPLQLCGECHSHQHSVTHPMGEQARDPRNGQPMDCLSCHGVHDAPHPMYLHREGSRELCLACHTDLGGGSR